MKITERHVQAAELLVAEQFSGRTSEQFAQQIGVARETLSRWRQDTHFQAEIARAHREWRREITHVPLVHRRRRLEELQKLFDVETNTSVRASLIRQVAEEVGGDVLEELDELRREIRPENAISLSRAVGE